MTPIVLRSTSGRIGDKSAESSAAMLRQKAGLAVVVETLGDAGRPLNGMADSEQFDTQVRDLLEAVGKGTLDAVTLPYSFALGLPPGVAMAAVLPREDPADIMLIKPPAFSGSRGLLPLRQSRIVICTSHRSLVQARQLRHDLRFREHEPGGRVVEQWLESTADALIIPAQELDREAIADAALLISRLDPERFVPAPCQGLSVILMRRADERFTTVQAALHDEDSRIAADIEMQVCARFAAHRHLALGTYARREDHTWWAFGFCALETAAPIWAETECTSYQLLADELYFKLAETEDETLPRH